MTTRKAGLRGSIMTVVCWLGFVAMLYGAIIEDGTVFMLGILTLSSATLYRRVRASKAYERSRFAAANDERRERGGRAATERD